MRQLAIWLLVLIGIAVVLIGTIRINVYNGGRPNIDMLLDEAITAETPYLVKAQNNSHAIRQVMNNLHDLFMFKLQSFSTIDHQQFRYTSSVMMSLALISTLGDDRADDSNLLFYMLYTSLGSMMMLLIIALLTQHFEMHFDTFFVSNNYGNQDESNEQYLLKASDISEEYLLIHLQKGRIAKRYADQISFGGNKLELYEEESRTIRHNIQPAVAVLLLLLLYIFLGAIPLHLIVDATNNLIASVLLNFFYIMTITTPKWTYLNNPNIWQLLFLIANLFVGSVLMCAANVNIGSALLIYSNDIFTNSYTNRQLQLETLGCITNPHRDDSASNHQQLCNNRKCVYPNGLKHAALRHAEKHTSVDE